MNVRRGMNRLFIVAWVAYALYVSWYAYNKEVDDDVTWASLQYRSCIGQDHGSAYETATREEYDRLRKDAEQLRLASETARLTLERHIVQHGC